MPGLVSVHTTVLYIVILGCRLYRLSPSSVQVLESTVESESYVTTDGQPASLSWSKAPIWGLRPDLYYLCDCYGLVLVGRPLWREVGSVFCMCCWPLPAQSFSGPSPLGLETIFYCLRFETSLFVAPYDSQGHGGGIRPRLHTGRCPQLLAYWSLMLEVNELVLNGYVSEEKMRLYSPVKKYDHTLTILYNFVVATRYHGLRGSHLFWKCRLTLNRVYRRAFPYWLNCVLWY
jgi:hypothetical protein